MSYSDQDNFFATAYRTGTDTWTAIPFNRRAHELALFLPKGSMVLDIGAGRGRLIFDLVKLGYRAIGIENNPILIKKVNEDIKDRQLEKDLRFIEGSALDIPLADHSFDGVVDVGLMQHMKPTDMPRYLREVLRVLRTGGFFFVTTLSRRTPKFLNITPSMTDIADYQIEGVHYHFFSDAELTELFEKDFEIKQLEHDMPFGRDGAIYTVLLLKKK